MYDDTLYIIYPCVVVTLTYVMNMIFRELYDPKPWQAPRPLQERIQQVRQPAAPAPAPQHVNNLRRMDSDLVGTGDMQPQDMQPQDAPGQRISESSGYTPGDESRRISESSAPQVHPPEAEPVADQQQPDQPQVHEPGPAPPQVFPPQPEPLQDDHNDQHSSMGLFCELLGTVNGENLALVVITLSVIAGYEYLVLKSYRDVRDIASMIKEVPDSKIIDRSLDFELVKVSGTVQSLDLLEDPDIKIVSSNKWLKLERYMSHVYESVKEEKDEDGNVKRRYYVNNWGTWEQQCGGRFSNLFRYAEHEFHKADDLYAGNAYLGHYRFRKGEIEQISKQSFYESWMGQKRQLPVFDRDQIRQIGFYLREYFPNHNYVDYDPAEGYFYVTHRSLDGYWGKSYNVERFTPGDMRIQWQYFPADIAVTVVGQQMFDPKTESTVFRAWNPLELKYPLGEESSFSPLQTKIYQVLEGIKSVAEVNEKLNSSYFLFWMAVRLILWQVAITTLQKAFFPLKRFPLFEWMRKEVEAGYYLFLGGFGLCSLMMVTHVENNQHKHELLLITFIFSFYHIYVSIVVNEKIRRLRGRR